MDKRTNNDLQNIQMLAYYCIVININQIHIDNGFCSPHTDPIKVYRTSFRVYWGQTHSFSSAICFVLIIFHRSAAENIKQIF
jgi:hypothetical protein